MSWRREERTTRWGDQEPRWGDNRTRSPVWEGRRNSESPERRSPQRDRHRDRFDRDRDRHRDERYRRDRYDRRDRDRDRRRSPKADDDVPVPPSPPKISRDYSRSNSRSRSRSRDRDDDHRHVYERDDNQTINASPGDWFCKCGLFNFKRRQVCYRRNCIGKRSEGVVYGGEHDKNLTLAESAGITKRLLFRRLDALTTEEKILDTFKERCSKTVLDSIAGITIGRETLTGASKCLAYINFNSIADSTAAHLELLNLQPPLVIDGREVLISFYTEPKKPPKKEAPDYSAYYAQQMAHYSQAQASLSEADRVNAAAAVAQSAIASAHARNLSWTPLAAPAFVSSNSQVAPAASVPTGDGSTKYSAPDMSTFMYDETSGYYYDPATGLYYDYNTQYFYNSQAGQYMYWDAATGTYRAATQTQQNTEQPKLPNPPQATTENTITKDPPEEKKKRDKEDKVKVAKKIAKDMERWARTLNQKKENAKSNIVMEQVLDTAASKGSADIGFSVLGSTPRTAVPVPIVREISPPPVGDEFLVKKVQEQPVFDNDDGIIDWAKLTCLLCKRRFPAPEVLTKHKTLSDLHKQNLAEFRKKNDLQPQSNGYRDRAAERRMKFGEDETPVRKRYDPPEAMSAPVVSHPPPSVVDTIGGKMLQKMGWSEGRGLGKSEQGRIAPIEAEQRPGLAGLGQKRGIYTPTPGETYRDTVKKLMIARYKEVVGQEEGK